MSGLLETNGLTVTYGGLNANDNVNISVAPGKLTGLIGPIVVGIVLALLIDSSWRIEQALWPVAEALKAEVRAAGDRAAELEAEVEVLAQKLRRERRGPVEVDQRRRLVGREHRAHDAVVEEREEGVTRHAHLVHQQRDLDEVLDHDAEHDVVANLGNARQLALGHLAQHPIQHLADGEVQHRVAQKLQPVLHRGGMESVGQTQQTAEHVANRTLARNHDSRVMSTHRNSSGMQRGEVGDVKSDQHTALPRSPRKLRFV